MKFAFLKFSVFAAAVVSFSSAIFAEIKTPKIFADNMLLQREKPVKIWGTAEPNAEVEAEFAGRKKSVRAAADGTWSVVFEPFAASKTPREMKFFENGKLSKSVKNVLVGELWICGGQSNMAFPLNLTNDRDGALARAKNYPNLRLLGNREIVASPYVQKDLPDSYRWEVASPDVAATFGAIPFHFGEKLMSDLDVPVGLVLVAVYGSSMGAWISAEDADAEPSFREIWRNFQKALPAWKNGGYQKALEAHKKKLAQASAENAALRAKGIKPKPRSPTFTIPPHELTPFNIKHAPSYHYNVKIAPLKGLSVRGVIWYQGESDTAAGYSRFKTRFETVVRLWRKYFGDENLPFVAAQLSSFGKGKYWAPIRRAQLSAASETPSLWLVNTIDVGSVSDVHPRDKKTVGNRMALLALEKVYKKDGIGAQSPVVKSVKFDGSRAEVEFDSFGKELTGRGAPRGFEVLIGKNWVDAKASLENGNVVVASPSGEKIEGVRYLCKPCPLDEIWLWGGDFPAFCFQKLKEL